MNLGLVVVPFFGIGDWLAVVTISAAFTLTLIAMSSSGGGRGDKRP